MTAATSQASPVPEGPSRSSMDGGAAFDSSDPYFTSDEFRMWSMKITRCPRARPHDWTLCPFAHPGEKAKRRDPRKFHYSGTACNEYRKTGACSRGDACCFSHGVFECWLHPARYRTQLCTDGTACRRRVCFFAHLESELRRPEEHVGLSPAMQAELAAEAEALQKQVQLKQALQELLGGGQQQRQPAGPATATHPGQLLQLHSLQPNAACGGMGGRDAMSAPGTPSYAAGGPELALDAGIDPLLLSALHALASPSPTLHPSQATALGSLVRRSMDASPLATRPVSAPMQYPQQYPSRHSVDLGSLSRGGGTGAVYGAPGTVLIHPQPAPPLGIACMPPAPPPILQGGFYSRSFPEYHAPPPPQQPQQPCTPLQQEPPPPQQDGYITLSSAGLLMARQAAGQLRAPAVSAVGREGEERRAQLQRIDEMTPTEDDDSSAASASMGKSESRGSSFDGSSGNSGGGKEAPSAIPVFPRAASFDNILAELPRSASQVNMTDVHMGLAGLAL